MWYSSRDLTSLFRGVTVPTNQLFHEIHIRGWQTTKVDVKDGQYVAEASSPHGDKAKKTGPDPATALAHLLSYIVRLESIRATHHRSGWGNTFTSQLEDIAKAYAQAPIFDPKAAGAWKELGEDSLHRFAVLGQQIKVEVTDDPVPYQSPQEMCEDVHKKKHLLISRADAHHPVWTVEQTIAFRAVHDVLGHCVSGGGFDWAGENVATAAHMPLLSPTAQQALFTETIGATAYGTYFRGFGPHKIVFLNEYLDKVQEEENDPGHAGVHPNLSLAPTELPTIPQPQPDAGGLSTNGVP